MAGKGAEMPLMRAAWVFGNWRDWSEDYGGAAGGEKMGKFNPSDVDPYFDFRRA